MQLPELLALDTNCFIYALEDPSSERGQFIVDHVLAAPEQRVVTATLVVAELLAQPYALGRPDRARALLQALESLPRLTIAPLTVAVAEAAARLRAELRLPLPDAIVLATAGAAGAPLLTNDRRLASAAGNCALLLDDISG